jgi:hypothetical protein
MTVCQSAAVQTTSSLSWRDIGRPWVTRIANTNASKIEMRRARILERLDILSQNRWYWRYRSLKIAYQELRRRVRAVDKPDLLCENPQDNSFALHGTLLGMAS